MDRASMRSSLHGDHQAMAEIMARARRCRVLPAGGAECFAPSCEQGEVCSDDVGQLMHELTIAAFAHFNREHALMTRFCSREHCRRHNAEHGDLMSAISAATSSLYAAKNNLGAIAGLAAVSAALDGHEEGIDTELIADLDGWGRSSGGR